MQDPNYAGKYGVEQQLKLLSKWLAETGFNEAAVLVSAAAISVYEAKRKKPTARPAPHGAPVREPLRQPVSASAAPLDASVVEPKRRAQGA